MWVIKLGGSVTRQDTLMHWLRLVARFGDGQMIIVPGGGLFADSVRAFQAMRATHAEGHLDDVQAHKLAIYAMDQMAHSLVAMCPELALVRNPLEIAERGWQHRGLIWCPSEMALHTQDDRHPLLASWQVTSDSLAAWLAWQCEAKQLLLVKSDDRLEPLQSEYDLPALQAQGILDHGMTDLLANAPFATWVCHHRQSALFAQRLDPTLPVNPAVLSGLVRT